MGHGVPVYGPGVGVGLGGQGEHVRTGAEQYHRFTPQLLSMVDGGCRCMNGCWGRYAAPNDGTPQPVPDNIDTGRPPHLPMVVVWPWSCACVRSRTLGWAVMCSETKFASYLFSDATGPLGRCCRNQIQLSPHATIVCTVSESRAHLHGVRVGPLIHFAPATSAPRYSACTISARFRL